MRERVVFAWKSICVKISIKKSDSQAVSLT